jgi:hypothetical protein
MLTSIHHHNTTKLPEQELQRRTVMAVRQADKVYSIMEFFEKPMSASQVLMHYDNKRVPITSIRRCLTNLVYEGKLEKTNLQVTGMYGVKEYQYKLVKIYENSTK